MSEDEKRAVEKALELIPTTVEEVRAFEERMAAKEAALPAEERARLAEEGRRAMELGKKRLEFSLAAMKGDGRVWACAQCGRAMELAGEKGEGDGQEEVWRCLNGHARTEHDLIRELAKQLEAAAAGKGEVKG